MLLKQLTAILAASALLLPIETSQMEEPPSDSNQPPLIQVAENEYTQTDFPWMAYRDDTGEISIVFGPGALDAKVDGTVVESREGTDRFQERLSEYYGSAAKASQVKWYCESNQTAPKKSGSQLQGYAGMACYGTGIPRGRIAWQFERNGASITGWSKYSSQTKYTNWQSGGTQGTYVYARCNSTDGRSRSYTTYMRPEFEGLGWVGSWKRSPVLQATKCGYKEL